MSIRGTLKYKESYPDIVYALMDVDEYNGKKYISYYADDSPSLGSDEVYIKNWNTQEEAQTFLEQMNSETWFKNRNHRVVPIKTKLKKFKSRYVPLTVAINNSFQ